MAKQHIVTQMVSVLGGAGLSKAKAYTADGTQSREVAIPDGTTDDLMNIAIDFSQLRNVFLLSDQDITIETNNATTPDDTINLKANVPLIWNADAYFSNPFTVDVTAFYLTNSSGSAATLNVEILEDATP